MCVKCVSTCLCIRMWDMSKYTNMASARPIFLTRIFLFLQQTEVEKGKMYIQVKPHHCAFYQYYHCYISSYLDEDSAPTIVPTIKGLNRDVGLHGKT